MERRSAVAEYMLADLVIINGKVVTVDSSFSIAQAVAVKGDKIVAVGRNDEIKALTGKKTKTIDLKGKTMLPGMNDTHCHISGWALSRPPFKLDLRYPAVKSLADILQRVAEKAGQVKPGEWILGGGWDEGYLDECLANPNRKPSKEDLDKVAPHNPVVLGEYSGHRTWVNSKAFEMAGVTKDTPDPRGGRIGRSPETGELTGLLYEITAIMLVGAAIPPWTVKQRKESLLRGMAELSSLGITSYTEGAADRDTWACYNDAFNEHFKDGKWTCRINMLLALAGLGESSLENKQALKYIGCRYDFGNEWLKVGGAKLVGDGIPPLKTAFMYEPYLDGTYGLLSPEGNTIEEQEKDLREMIKVLHANRLQVGIHSCGERTTDICSNQYMKCIEEDPWDARHYIIHSDFAMPETIKRIGEFKRRTGYEVGLNVQSGIKWTISDFMATVVGPERAGYHWPLRTMLDNGIRVANSSDAPAIYPDWKLGVQSAVLRESKATGKVSGPEQCISVAEAITTFTLNGAWLDRMENVKGSIEEGKLADFCILDKDIMTVDPHDIKDIRNLMTIVGGKVVYDTGAL